MPVSHLLLPSGARMPAMGFGTWGLTVEQTPPAVRAAVAAGYELLDLAAVYRNEHVVGETLQQLFAQDTLRREHLFLTSKVPPTAACSRKDVFEAAERTLAALKTSYLDLYLVHYPFCVKPGSSVWPPPLEFQLGYSAEQLRETWRHMEALVAAGRVRSIGLSNIGVNRLRKLVEDPSIKVKPSVVQVEFHPYLQSAPLLTYCASQRIAVTAYCSLGSLARPSKYVSASDPVLLEEPTLTRIGARLRAAPAQIALAWALHKGVAIIPKSATATRIEANRAALELRLAPADVAAIDALERGHRFLASGWMQYAWRPQQKLEEILDDPAEAEAEGGRWAPSWATLLPVLVAGGCFWLRRRTQAAPARYSAVGAAT